MVERILDTCFGFTIESGCGFVKKKYLWIFHKNTRNGNSSMEKDAKA